MSDRYLKQVIVVRKDLSMPTGKLAAIVAHASMTFLLKRLQNGSMPFGLVPYNGTLSGTFTSDEIRWMNELDPGLEEMGQISMAKIVCAVNSEAELWQLFVNASAIGNIVGFQVHPVYDSGHSHNKVGDFAAIAIGPAWPEALEPITGKLKVYR